MNIDSLIHHLKSDFEQALLSIHSLKELEQLRVDFLGKKGRLASFMMSLKDASQEEKPRIGKEVNLCKQLFEQELFQREERLKIEERERRFEREWIDVTLPGRSLHKSALHPVTQIMDQALDVLVGMGFSIQLGPNLDTDHYNFGALNFAKDHPAREMQDTFYVTTEYLLRTHTSNGQVRVMEQHKPPIRAVIPGRCFRNETISARSHVFFHQIEGFYVDQSVTFIDLLATMEIFWKKLLGEEMKTRFRPSYFPFVEPGVEVDILCTACRGKGCRLCKHTGWLEVAGAGMVHPHVLQAAGIDPTVYSGYAWGMGMERLALLSYGIPDIRLFTENNQRLSAQFAAL